MENTGASTPRRLFGWLAQEPVLSVLAFALIVLQWLRPQPVAALAGLVDWQTVATLAGLLMLTKALELSGCLMWLAHRIVHHVRSERGLAMLLVGFAAALAMWLTNDVALFVVVPLMVSLRALTPLPFRRLVIVVALSVNAGSVATPLGNPQNLFLWQLSGVSFGGFVIALGPLALALMALLLALTACAFRAKPLDLSGDVAEFPVQRTHAAIATVLFAAFVLLADAHHPLPGLLAVAIVLLAVKRDAVLKIDWLLLLIFVLMFVVLRSAAALPAVHDAIARAHLDSPLRVFAAGAVLSQGISNVPAAILLSEFTRDWRALAFGVSVGGFGFAIGSLANLIAVRLAKEPRMWLPFHLVSIPFALASAGLGAWLLVLHG
ncbi:citrate transporter [Burkholderia dolosa]|jgi:Na+/H+ antiporter NhaD/arsenite permease-like protein|uniref:Citrate transporter n=1 Tax=Burkholderia dolosa TaxID=152500 RepID=A0A892I9I5_9BURK|nr:MULTISPECIES: SLC13 family permease [Burkholderia]AKE02255.1 citrate transporter [Burkholderia cepacia]AJY14354.1 citrate transporter family protein [Burkholderia dolosa AU0158]AYZ96998.1 citrate transporter [Burkholderia dolosa]EAY67469.1 Di- and tricarboxylate transporter [Burkholderia dolosa AU0158]ETP64033.1 citrate transporter [Burkholderia dolosa PC543]